MDWNSEDAKTRALRIGQAMGALLDGQPAALKTRARREWALTVDGMAASTEWLEAWRHRLSPEAMSWHAADIERREHALLMWLRTQLVATDSINV